MEKKVSSTGMYETKSGKLDNQTKAALLEYLTECDEFHKLVCDITGTERKQVKVSPELEKLKEDYSHMCESYEHEKQQRNDLIRKWREETEQRLDAERERDSAKRHHKFVMDEIFSMLKEVECSSVRGIVDSLKAERANGKLLAEDNELCRRENDKLKIDYEKTNKALQELHLNHILKLRKELEAQKDLVKKYVAKSEKLQSKLDKASKRFSDLEKSYFCIHKEANEIKNSRKNLSANYDRLIEDYNCLITRYNNQKKYIAKYIEENKRLIDQVEKLKGRLNRAAKNYGELIKTISDKAMKSI